MYRMSLAVFSLALGVSAQATVQSSMVTDSPLGVIATTGASPQFDGAPKGTVVPPVRFTLRRRASVSGSSTSASMSAYAYVEADGNGATLGATGSARGTSAVRGFTAPVGSASGAQPGPVAFLLRMKSTANRSGVLRIRWQSLLKNTATAAASIDVGNDQSIEWRGGDTSGAYRSFTVPANFDRNGDLAVRLTLATSVTGAGAFVYSSTYGRLSAEFADGSAGQCKITNYGAGCAGSATAGGSVKVGTTHVITLKTGGGFPNAFVIEAVGSTKVNLPLPGGCALLSNALFVDVHPTDATGSFQRVYRQSVFRRSLTFHQFLPVQLQNGALVLRASNGVQIECTGS